VSVPDRDGDTPLHRAAGNGNAEIARMLLDKGADVNARDKEGLSAVHWTKWAKKNVQAGVVDLLKQRGGV